MQKKYILQSGWFRTALMDIDYMFWKSGSMFQSSVETRIMTDGNRSVLMLPAALSESAGDYTCRAENVAGSVTCSATLGVTPAWETAVELQSPVFTQTPTHAKVMDGEATQFVAKVLKRVNSVFQLFWLCLEKKPFQISPVVTWITKTAVIVMKLFAHVPRTAYTLISLLLPLYDMGAQSQRRCTWIKHVPHGSHV